MTIIGKHDWEELGKKFKGASPFPSICIDNFLEKSFADLLASSYPKYSDAKLIGREFSTVNEKLKVQITDPSLFTEPMQALSEALGSADFLEKLSILSGIENLQWDPKFTGGGVHLTSSSGILDVHIDFNYEKKLGLYRRLNILIYLNPVWEKEWGGEVELWDNDVEKCIQSFEPIHNRCVLFETSDYSYHGVTAVDSKNGLTRNSFAAYYYTEEAGNNKGDLFGGMHDTIFKARPEEKVKMYWLMPLEKIMGACRKSKDKLKAKVKGMLN